MSKRTIARPSRYHYWPENLKVEYGPRRATGNGPRYTHDVYVDDVLIGDVEARYEQHGVGTPFRDGWQANPDNAYPIAPNSAFWRLKKTSSRSAATVRLIEHYLKHPNKKD